jgi:hypothetical protein
MFLKVSDKFGDMRRSRCAFSGEAAEIVRKEISGGENYPSLGPTSPGENLLARPAGAH